jgi:hypothetical protein
MFSQETNPISGQGNQQRHGPADGAGDQRSRSNAALRGNLTAFVGLVPPPASPYAVHGSTSEIQHARTAEDKSRAARDAGRSCPQYEAARPEAPAQGQKKARLGGFSSSSLYKRTLRRTHRIGLRTMNNLKQKFDASTVAIMRQALNEVVADHRFLVRKSVTPLEVAYHILRQAASGVRDLNHLKSSAFKKLSALA